MDMAAYYKGVYDSNLARERIHGEIDDMDILSTKELPDRGVVFYGTHNIEIGRLKHVPGTDTYKMEFNPKAKEEIRRINAIEKKKEKNRRLKVQRRNRFVGIALAGVIGIGAITSGINSLIEGHNAKKDALEEFQMQSSYSYQLLMDAPEAVQFGWANYEMGRLQDAANDSSYSQVKAQVESVYTDSFVPVASKYYDMCEMNDLGLSEEYRDRLGYTTRVNDEFRDNMNAYLNDVSRLNPESVSHLFISSPYNGAIVLDSKPSSSTVVYIPASNLPEDSPYNMDNLPSDALLINGKVYVPESCLGHTLDNGISK